MSKTDFNNHKVVSSNEWLEARKQLLREEKEFTRLRDRLSRQRRELPWVKVEKNYIFDGPDGKRTLAELFTGKSQLVIYHFMFGPAWERPCRACSFWADSFNGIGVHLKQRDVHDRYLASAVGEVRSVQAANGLDFQVVLLSQQRFQL